MQTFLPYPDFRKSARCLDNKRLGKQRVEVLQILKALRGESLGWRNHPAVLMWKGFDNALVEYGLIICNEWIKRGYKDRCAKKIASYRKRCVLRYPPWLGNRRFHNSHKSNLKRKDPIHYKQFKVPDNLPYIWPVTKDK